VNAWAVCCESCNHRWNLVGSFSEYERQAIESRPCPKCGAYTLSSPEPTKPGWKKMRSERPAFGSRLVKMAG
jgi:hypothetical protein